MIEVGRKAAGRMLGLGADTEFGGCHANDSIGVEVAGYHVGFRSKTHAV